MTKAKKLLAWLLNYLGYTLLDWSLWLRVRANRIDDGGDIPRISIALVLALSLAGQVEASSLRFSFVDTQGNAETQTISIAADHNIESDDKKNLQEIKGGMLYGEVDGKRTAESWNASIKDTHRVGRAHIQADASHPDKNHCEKQTADCTLPYWFNLTGIEGDAFAGFELRLSFNIGAGILFSPADAPHHEINLEAGPGLTYEERDDGDVGYITARTWGKYTWHITDRLELFAETEYIYDYEDARNYRANGEAGLTGKINDWLSMQLGPKIKYVNQPPDGKERTDIITAASVIVSF